ncbi:MAG: family 10 glycosylhydrolase [Bacteroidales bacterium]|nr:family 10 glycosylhydrolase [Bacteroidales bacterium]
MKLTIALALVALTAMSGFAQTAKKHEFRGAWLHIIGQKQYSKMTPEATREYLVGQLNELKANGVNAVIWQIRPQADAAYISDLEPWSKWISGTAGVAPNPVWDPLQFMIEQCHKRGMELHAWINPYRVTSGKDDKPAAGHVYYKHPEWFVKYADGKLYFDPGLPESRNFIDKVVRDIIGRYDVDAIHMDDYFYPYPVTGVDFPDDASWEKYGKGFNDRGDWRRHNVDLLIEQLHNTLQEVKPWVQLGISPFGIWRNKSVDPRGSETNGLQCYDALYADCPKWTKEGWVDYMVPQLYWEQEHPRANNEHLMHWWNGETYGRGMYYGYSVSNMMTHKDTRDSTINNQLGEKIELQRKLENVTGMVWWPGYLVTQNFKQVGDKLKKTHMATQALAPTYTWLDNKAPEAVRKLKAEKSCCETVLRWTAPKATDEMQKAARYVVYRFKKGQAVDISKAEAIVEITGETCYHTRGTLKGNYTYAVTAVDRCNNESAPVSVNVEIAQ